MKFKKIYIEITNQCNLNCPFCAGTSRKPAFMSVEDFEQVVIKIKPHTAYVYLHVLGEPLLHTDIGALMNICHGHGLQVNITTNGTLMKRFGTQLLTPALRQVNVSMHSVPTAAPTSVARQYADDILAFTEKCKGSHYVNLRFWNKDDQDEQSVYLLNRIQRHFGYEGDLMGDMRVANGVKMSPNVYVQMNTKFTWPSANGEAVFTAGKCYGLKDHIGILVDGTVVPCCLDSEGTINLGNIFKQPLAEILNTPRVKAMKSGFTAHKVVEPFCQSCGFALRLNRNR